VHLRYGVTMSGSFSSLSLTGRARRLRQLAWNALDQYDLDVRQMRLISNDWNCVFRLDTPDRPYALRVSLPGRGHTPETVRSEAVFLDALATQSDIDVPAPVPAKDGRLVVSAEAPGVPEPRMCGVYSWIVGEELGKSMTPDNAFLHGELLARLHDFAEQWTPPVPFVVNDYTQVFHFPGEEVLWNADLCGYETLFREALSAANELIHDLRERDPILLTHGDLHQRNCKLHEGVLRPIDFEDVMWATRGLDVGTTLFYLSRCYDYTALLPSFRDGYDSVAPWPEGQANELQQLRFPRALDLLNVFAAEPDLRTRSWEQTVERIANLAKGVVYSQTPTRSHI
jgi:Ser/Thr protein kinase RdoA (MazF antagonist)